MRRAGVRPYLEDRTHRSQCGSMRGARTIRNDTQFSLCSNRMGVGTIYCDRKEMSRNKVRGKLCLLLDIFYFRFMGHPMGSEKRFRA